MSSELPSPNPSQAYVHASVLEAGHVSLREQFIIQNGSSTKFIMVPSMAFLLRHSQNDKIILFDLGIRKDWENLPPVVTQTIKALSRVNVPVDVVDSLRRGGLEPDNVDFVILSHVHWDHVGDPNLFPKSRFITGAASEAILAKGYTPENTTAAAAATEQDFAKDLLPASRTIYIPCTDWKPIGPFDLAHDFFGDGSVYLIDAPGHLGGHINLLVRTSADGSWLYLGGDSAHDTRIISGEKEIAVFPHPITGGLICMHKDIEVAKKHIARIRRLGEIPKVHVLMTHDLEWFERNKEEGVVFPGDIKPL